MSEPFGLNDLLTCLVELERAGQGIYVSLAQKHAGDPELYKLFTGLAAWEKRHEELYSGILLELAQTTGAVFPADSDSVEFLRSLVLSTMPLAEFARHPVTDMTDALRMALQLEKDTVLFLNELLPHLPEEFSSLNLLQSVMREEKRHVTTIQTLLMQYGGR